MNFANCGQMERMAWEPEKIQHLLTSRELKVKPKSANTAGLQLADLIANPSRSEILAENGLLGRELGAFAKGVVEVLEEKYYRQRRQQSMGKRFYIEKGAPFRSSPNGQTIHLRMCELTTHYIQKCAVSTFSFQSSFDSPVDIKTE